MQACGAPARTFSMMDSYTDAQKHDGCYVNPFVGEGLYARYLRTWLGVVPKQQVSPHSYPNPNPNPDPNPDPYPNPRPNPNPNQVMLVRVWVWVSPNPNPNANPNANQPGDAAQLRRVDSGRAEAALTLPLKLTNNLNP
jgi:hypothetical protein